MSLSSLMLVTTVLQFAESHLLAVLYGVKPQEDETLAIRPVDGLVAEKLEKWQDVQASANFTGLCSDSNCVRSAVSRQAEGSSWTDVCNSSMKLSITVLPSDSIESVLSTLINWDSRLTELHFEATRSINTYLSSGNASLAVNGMNLTSDYIVNRRAWISDMQNLQLSCPQVHVSDSTFVQSRFGELRAMRTNLSVVVSVYSLQHDAAFVMQEIADNKAKDARDRFFDSKDYEVRLSRLENCTELLTNAQFTLEYLGNLTREMKVSYLLAFPWAASFMSSVDGELGKLRSEVGDMHSLLKEQLRTGVVFRDYVDPVVYGVMLVFGLVWNFVLLHILTRHKNVCTPPNIVLFNFAIVDILNLSIKIPCYYIAKYYSPILYIGVNACRTFVSFRITLLYAIKFSVLTLSAQRYIATVTTSKTSSWACLSAWNGMSERHRAIALSLTVWFGALMCGVPPGIVYHFTPDVCIAQVTHPSPIEALDIFYILFACVMLPVPIAVFSFLTSRRLRRSVHQVSGAENQRSARIRSARVVTAIAMVFVMTQIPRSFWFCYAAWFHLNRRLIAFFYVDTAIVYLFYLNSCLNPVALYVASSELRRHFNSIFFWWCPSVSSRRADSSTLTNFT